MDNRELIIPLLNFEQKESFYSLIILKRKKDQPEEEKESHQSVRTIKTYCIDNIEYLEKKWDEITHICEYFKARAYINLNKQNHNDIGLEMLSQLALRIKNGVVHHKYLFDSVVGSIKPKNCSWVVDIDNRNERYINSIKNLINNCMPQGNKIIAEIPTKNGLHLITHPFNTEEFKKKISFNEIPEIGKNNPTLLYLPNSLK